MRGMDNNSAQLLVATVTDPGQPWDLTATRIDSGMPDTAAFGESLLSPDGTQIATTYTSHYAAAHGVGPLAPKALTHGFTVAFYVLAAIALAAAVLGPVLIERHPSGEAAEERNLPELELLEEAA